MSDYGVTDSGFVRPRLAEIKSDIEDALTEAFGVTISTDADSVLGQIIGVWSEREATLWEVAEDSYNAMYPNTATGTNLDNSVAFTGIQRISAEKTTIMATCYGTNGTTITADSQIKSSADESMTFTVSEAGTISISSASYLDIELNTVASGATYSLTLDKSTYTYTATSSDETTILVAIAALLSSLEATVTVSNSHLYIDKTDHSSGYSVSISTNMTLNEIGSPLEFACDTYGEIDPDVGTVTKIVTQIFGWNSVKNNVEATVGREDETDSELRQRYGSAVFQTGSAMVESIQAAIADLDGVTMANVYENVSDEIDSDGRPPHSIEAVVYGGTKSEIAEVLWKKKAPGISTYGSVEVDVTDSQSIKHTMKFNRPTVKSVWIKAVLEENPDEDFAADNPTEVQSLILAKGQALSVGQDVILQRFLGPIYSGTTGIGTVTITAAVSDTTPASSDYSADNISIGAREIADFSTDRIEVTTA